MFIPIQFYDAFMLDFFIFKQATYKNIIDNFEKAEPIVLFDVHGYKKEDYIKTLRSSIRFTYFHSIETLFEIIFAIEKGIRVEVNEHQDELILQRLSKSDFRENFERISLIANRDTKELGKWDEMLSFKSVGSEITLLRYLFYYILSPSNTTIGTEWWERMESSLQAIKETLILLATEFADRKEYNSYKHGLRIIPIAKSFQAFETGTNKELMNLDLSDSMTFLHQQGDEINLITKGFDTERDFNMTVVVSDLLDNIIGIRKGVYFKEKNKLNIRFFETERLKDLSKSNIRTRELKFTLR